jgi:mono/diheme cytochrome c family protein
MGKRKRGAKRSRRGKSAGTPMPTRSNAKRPIAFIGGGLAALAAIGIALYALVDRGPYGGAAVDVRVPAFSAVAQRGARAFAANCVQCHGTNAAGTDKGPPLVHRIYEPSHHGDAAIRRAARLGVRPHHWRFGSMPKIDVSDRELDAIIVYIRELQRANGIR